MLVKGDVKCLHCGFISGTWVGAGGAPLTISGFKPPEGQPAPAADPNCTLHCGRCDGPVFLDDASSVINTYRLRRIKRLREQIAALDAKRAARAA